MKLQSVNQNFNKPQTLVKNDAPKPNDPPPPQDGYKPSLGSSAIRNGIAWGNATGTVVGGATGLATVTGALYAGVLGGAIVGSLTGAGFGPVLGAVTSHGALDFVGRTFATAGFFAKTGMVIGGLSGAAGAWQVGNGIGNAVGKAAGFVPGAIVGGAQGLWAKAENAAGGGEAPPPAKEDKPSLLKTNFTDLNNMSGGMKLYASILGGVGMLSGAVGGFTLGASVASAGSLASGLLASNVSLSAIGAAGVAGGIVGGALFAAVGGLGGFTAAKASKKVWDHTGGKLLGMTQGDKESQNAKGKRLDEKKVALDTREDGLKADAETKRAFYRDETKKLDERETGIEKSEADVKGRLDEINGKIEAGGQAQYADKAAKPDAQTGESLVNWDSRLKKFDGELKDFAGQLKSKEGGLDAQITKESDAKFAQDRRPVEQRYDGLQGELNGKETGLNERKRQIDGKIQDGYQAGVSAQKPGLQQELRYAQDDRDRAQNDFADAQRDRNNAAAQLSSAQSQLSTARNEADQNQGRVNKLNTAIRDLDNQKDNLQAEHRQADNTTADLQSKLQACRNS
ncbi:hypothetical protein IV102_02495 [bacterium]|nr:hypothetical protein [bacterium]